MRTALALSVITAAFSLVACGSDSGGDSTAVNSTQTAKPPAAPDAGIAAKPGGSGERTTPTAAAKTPAYTVSHDLCSAFGPAKVAKSYGGGPSPPEIALAYAQTSYRPGFQQDAFEGCLDGFNGK